MGKKRSDSVVEGIADKGGDRRLDVGIADGLAVAVGGSQGGVGKAAGDLPARPLSQIGCLKVALIF